jgi:hypothetical protein
MWSSMSGSQLLTRYFHQAGSFFDNLNSVRSKGDSKELERDEAGVLSLQQTGRGAGFRHRLVLIAHHPA